LGMGKYECANCVRLRAEYSAYVERTEKRIKDLEEKLGKNSSNSSIPPSANPPGSKKPVVKKPTGRKPGGQPGRPYHPPFRFSPGQLQDVIHHYPKACQGCGGSLPKAGGKDVMEPRWHQVVDIPPLLVEVMEHQSHARCCPGCHVVTWGEIPGKITSHRFGPRLAALVGYLSGSPHVSKRGIGDFLEQVFGLPLALGSVSNLEQELSKALAVPYAEALEAVRRAAVKNVDETGWKKGGRTAWAWGGPNCSPS